jgi:hypothetical protein
MAFDLPPEAPSKNVVVSDRTINIARELAQSANISTLTDRVLLGGKIIIGDIEVLNCTEVNPKDACQGQSLYWVKAEILDPRLFAEWANFSNEFLQRHGIAVDHYLLQLLAIELGILPQDIRLDLYLDCQSIVLHNAQVSFGYCRQDRRWALELPEHSDRVVGRVR